MFDTSAIDLAVLRPRLLPASERSIDLAPIEPYSSPQRAGAFMNREIVGFLLLSLVCLEVLFSNATMNITSPCGENCGLEVISHPVPMVGGAMLAIFLFTYKQIKPKPQLDRPVLIWRRLSAFFLDMFVVLSVAMPPILLVILVFRFLDVGVWEWTFQTADDPLSNLTGFVAVMCMFVALYSYFWLHSENQRATIGQYIMGFQILKDSEHPRFGWSPVIAYIALCSVHFWIWFKKQEDSDRGWYWWDRAAGTRAVMVSA